MPENTTHTPGPWVAADQGEGTRGKSLGICVSNARRLPMFFLPRGTPEHAANARLIAAAPELLAALETMEQIFTVNGEGFLRGKVANQIRAALAKARGEV